MCFQDLQEYLDGAAHGVIYFSLGSMLQAKTLPDDKRDAFLQAFSELPQRVLWKWEGDTLPGKPKNVWTEKWCPQNDILSKLSYTVLFDATDCYADIQRHLLPL
jgi:glucuronosyltransferase